MCSGTGGCMCVRVCVRVCVCVCVGVGVRALRHIVLQFLSVVAAQQSPW